MRRAWYWTNDYYYLLRAFWNSMRVNEGNFDLTAQYEKKLAVIVVSGLSFKWGFLRQTIDVVSNKGFCVCPTPELGRNYLNIDSSARQIENIIKKNNLQNVVILGYSKGGIVGKYAMLHNNLNHAIKGVVAVAAPFNGSRLGGSIPHKSFRELGRKSSIVKALSDDASINSMIYSIYPVFDNHVWPQGGSVLSGAHNIEIPVRGHHKVLFDKKVHEVIIEALEEIESSL